MKKLLLILIGLTALYGGIGFLYLPGVINAQLTEQLQKHSGQNFRSASTSFNPFTFTLELGDISVQDKQSEWFKAQSMSINLSAWKLLSGHYSISDFTLNHPLIQSQWDEQGQLIQPVLQLDQSEATDEPIPLNIEQFKIKGGEWQISQSHQLKPTTLSGITFTLEDFQLNQGTAQGELKVQLGKASQVELSAQFDQVAQAVLLNWSLNQLNLAEWSTYLPAGISKPKGTVNSAGQLLWQLDVQPILSIKNLEAEGFGIEVDGMARISEAFIKAENAAVDFNHQAINVELLATEQGQITWLNTKDNNSNTRVEEQANPWQFQLNHLIAYQTTVNLPEQWLQGPMLIDSLKSQHFGNSQSSASQWEATVHAGPSGQLHIQAELTQQPLAMQGTLNMTEWPLPTFNPMLFPEHNFSIQKGLFNTDQAFTWEAAHWQTAGPWRINEFTLLDGSGLTVAEWPALTSSGGGVNGTSQTLYLGDLNLDQAQGFITLVSDSIYDSQSTDEPATNWQIELGPIR